MCFRVTGKQFLSGEGSLQISLGLARSAFALSWIKIHKLRRSQCCFALLKEILVTSYETAL